MPTAPLPRPAPLRCAADALRLLSMAASDPAQHETLCFPLDARGVGGVLVAVSGTVEPDSVLDVVEVVARAAADNPTAHGLVVASFRPDDHDLHADDADRWLDIDRLVWSEGLELIEWYVVHHDGIECPRELLGEPERWPGQ